MSNPYSKLLTKSDYLTGMKCPSLLWMSKHEKHKLPEPDENQKHIFEMGDVVGNYAKKLFPRGKVVEWDKDLNKSIRETKELIKARKIIFEAVITAGPLYARPDILVPAPGNMWDVLEVKSSTQVKDEHIHDLSFQKHCYEKAGLNIRKCVLVLINSDYVKKGKIIPKKLFKKEDITSEVTAAQEGIEDRISKMLDIIAQDKMPQHSLSHSCSNPHECPLMDDCWEIVPDYSVFEFYRMGKKAFELYEKGVVLMKDVPADYKLTDNQKVQCNCARAGKPHINKEQIKEFLSQINYPLYFMDFETLGLAVPVFDGTKPFQQVPFQFSVHVVKKQGDKPKHISFLAKGDKDPRTDFAKKLMASLGKKGNIVTYNASFEKGILEELSKKFPKYKKSIKSINERIIDLLIPFRTFCYYDPKQNGSASIKKVLPALTGKSYDGMEIGDGGTATIRFYRIVKHFNCGEKVPKEEITKTRKGLEDYCGLDTEGMIWILDKLYSEV